MTPDARPTPARVGQNLLGAFSLALLFSAAMYTLLTVDHSASACPELYPILAVLFGSSLGFVWELFGGPASLQPLVRAIRVANVANVNVTLFRLAASFSPPLDYPLLYIFLAAFTFVYIYLGHDKWRMDILLPFLQLSAIVVVALPFITDSPRLSLTSRALLVAANVVNFVAGPLAARAPPRLFSFVLHLVFAASFALYPLTLANLAPAASSCPAYGSDHPSLFDLLVLTFPRALLSVVTHIPSLLALVAGLVAGARLSRTNANELRYNLTFPFWWILHRFLLSRPGPSPTVPVKPGSLSPVTLSPPAAISFRSYGRKHVNAAPLSLPAAARIPEAQFFKQDQIKTVFDITDWADVNMPACDPLEEPRFKPRVDPALGMPYYWRPKLLNFPVPETPAAMQRAFNDGQLMAYVLMHSHGWRNVRLPTPDEVARLAPHSPINRVLDFSHLAQYDQRDGYNPYGGQVYLTAYDSSGTPLPAAPGDADDDDTPTEIASLRVIAMAPPRAGIDNLVVVPTRAAGGTGSVAPGDEPGWDQVMYAQRSIHASSIFTEVVLHHLLEIHMITSIISVALYNTFDTKDSSKPHPFRAAMHVHFYSSTQVQELTTPHLLNRYATFPQIFALRAHAVAQALDDHFFSSGDEAVLLADCDVTRRSEVMNTPQLRDELEYRRVFDAYATQLVRCIWLGPDAGGESGKLSDDEAARIDEALAKDELMTEFLHALGKQLPQGVIPSRFLGAPGGDAWTAAGVVRFLAEVVHLVTVRHETLGTKMALASVDYRFSGLGAHVADGGLPPKDNYSALLLITAATALKPFPLLLDAQVRDDVTACFVGYLGQDDGTAQGMAAAFARMTDALGGLQKEWEADGAEFNSDRLRVMPDELNVMAGY